MRFWLLYLMVGFSAAVCAQGSFAPAAGISGSTAVFKDSAIFKSWASSCNVVRGYRDIARPLSGRVNYGSDRDALGFPNPNVVSLGDSGVANLGFEGIIYDGPGADFAVFENGFSDEYLEYGFVEVSSNGVDYLRFSAYFEGDTSTQIGAYDLKGNPTFVHNLAGKYRAQYGTPFDLSDLPDTAILNKDSVRFIRIIDVIGTIAEPYAMRDALGRKINDTYPTPFATNDSYTGGFDLDAVGLIHYTGAIYTSVSAARPTGQISIYPNPARSYFRLSGSKAESVMLLSMIGQKFQISNPHGRFPLTDIPTGKYAILSGQGAFLGFIQVL
jgi:hypothetical protein